jgi:thioredoxin 1
MPTPVTEQSLERDVLQSEIPVIVGFWAEWCGPCHALTPILERITDERAGELRFVKVNIDEERGLAERYGVQAIPTTILFKGGEPTAVAFGAQPKGAMERALGLVAEAA